MFTQVHVLGALIDFENLSVLYCDYTTGFFRTMSVSTLSQWLNNNGLPVKDNDILKGTCTVEMTTCVCLDSGVT